jgi:hypothetical protein
MNIVGAVQPPLLPGEVLPARVQCAVTVVDGDPGGARSLQQADDRGPGGGRPGQHHPHVARLLPGYPQRVGQRAEYTTAVPCWSSWNTGTSRASRSRRSTSKQRGAAMSCGLMPPNPGATALTHRTIYGTSRASRHSGHASMPANLLYSAAMLTALATGGTSLVIAGSALIGFGVGTSVSPALFVAGFSLRSARIQRAFALIELLRGVTAFLIAPILLFLATAVGVTKAAGMWDATWICLAIVGGSGPSCPSRFHLPAGPLTAPPWPQASIGVRPQFLACFIFEQGHGQQFPVYRAVAGQGTAVGAVDQIGELEGHPVVARQSCDCLEFFTDAVQGE